MQLIRPLSYAAGHLSRAMGERVVRFAINLTVGGVIALALVGPIPVSISGLAMFVMVLPVAFVLDFFGMFLVGLSAFWLESAAGLALIYSRAVMMFGGMFLPLEDLSGRIAAGASHSSLREHDQRSGKNVCESEFRVAKGVADNPGRSGRRICRAGFGSSLVAFRRLFANGG